MLGAAVMILCGPWLSEVVVVAKRFSRLGRFTEIPCCALDGAGPKARLCQCRGHQARHWQVVVLALADVCSALKKTLLLLVHHVCSCDSGRSSSLGVFCLTIGAFAGDLR